MSDKIQIPLTIEICRGYGPELGERLDRCFDENMDSGRIVALRMREISPDFGPDASTVAALAFPEGAGILSIPLLTAPAHIQDGLGGLFFSILGDIAFRTQRKELHAKTSKLTLYCLRHGIVALHSELLQPGMTTDVIADQLGPTTTLLLARNGSNHDRMVFTQQALTLMRRLSDNAGHRSLTFCIAS